MYIFIAIIILIIFAPICASVYLFVKTVLRSDDASAATKMSGGSWDKHRLLIDESRKWLDEAKCERLTIESFDGLRLAGYFYPASEPNGCLVLAFNGYRSNSRAQYSHITRFLNGLGYDVVLADDRAHGQSEGRYVGFGVLDRYDCLKWVENLDKKFTGSRKIFLYGVSMGAATVLMASNLNLPKSVKGIISDCGFTSAHDVFKHVLNSWYHLPAFPILNITNLLCRIFAGYDNKSSSSVASVAESRLPLLVIHGKNDTFVPSYMAPMIYKASNSVYKKLLTVNNACHAESYYIDMENYKKTMIDFINHTKNL